MPWRSSSATTRDVRVVFLTMHRDAAYARRALEAGAAGFVLKHSAAAELLLAVRAALQGRTFITPDLAAEVFRKMNQGNGRPACAALTPRQREILQLLAEGKSAKEIASVLGLSARTVEDHKYRLMESLGIENSAELIHLPSSTASSRSFFRRAPYFPARYPVIFRGHPPSRSA